MTVTPYEWAQRADASANAPLPFGLPAVQPTQTAQPADGNPTTVLGDTAFKVTFASGYDPDYYKNFQDKCGLDYDYFKQANCFVQPNTGDHPSSVGVPHNGASGVGS